QKKKKKKKKKKKRRSYPGDLGFRSNPAVAPRSFIHMDSSDHGNPPVDDYDDPDLYFDDDD
ncbi:unnamed protein product, partial [Urochloa humidicola]